MSRSEFRFNKKRKHYAYIFKDLGIYRKNVIFTTKAFRLFHGSKRKNIELHKHPNKNSNVKVYVIPLVYIDSKDSFDKKVLDWVFDKNDKRLIKRLKKIKVKKKRLNK